MNSTLEIWSFTDTALSQVCQEWNLGQFKCPSLHDQLTPAGTSCVQHALNWAGLGLVGGWWAQVGPSRFETSLLKELKET